MMTGNGVMHNGTTTVDDYGQNLDKLKVHCEIIERRMKKPIPRLAIVWLW